MLDEAVVKELCEKAAQETDAEKAAELVVSLRKLIEMESDETRLRIRQILLHYGRHLPITDLVGKPRNSISSVVAALVAGMHASTDKGN